MRRHEHRLGEEFFDLARAIDGALVVIGKLFNAENRDDVLQILVALQNRFHAARHRVVLGADNSRIQNPRIAGQWIDRWINSALHNLAGKVCRRVQVRKCCCWRGVRVVVGGHVNRLHRRNRTGLRGSNAFLQFTNFRVQVRLITHGARHAAQ